VESAVLLLDEMTKEGIRPNVVTYNTIIDAFSRSAGADYSIDASIPGDNSEGAISTAVAVKDVATRSAECGENNKVMEIFGQLAAERSFTSRKFNQNRQELLCILGVFHKMHELEIRPNVVTFSAILNACRYPLPSLSLDPFIRQLKTVKTFGINVT